MPDNKRVSTAIYTYVRDKEIIRENIRKFLLLHEVLTDYTYG